MRNICGTGGDARLNLGCGDDVRQGYLNIDFRPTHPNVIQVDLSKYPWPFADRSAKEILMLDFLEHFPYASTPFILLECYRVLQDDGEVIIQVPDAEILAKALINRGDYQCNRCGHSMQEIVDPKTNWVLNTITCRGCQQYFGDISEAAMRRLFGGQDFPGNTHYTCFTEESLKRKARDAGLVFSRFEEERHQAANWNFKAVFRKTNLWEKD